MSLRQRTGGEHSLGVVLGFDLDELLRIDSVGVLHTLLTLV